MRILKAEYPRFPGSSLSSLGKSGPKARLKSVVDGQLVKIPAPLQSEMWGHMRKVLAWNEKARRSI